MMIRRMKWVVFICIMAIVSSALVAQTAATKKTQMSVKFDRAYGTQSGKKYTLKYEKAIITLDDTKLTADNVVQDTDNDVHVFTATGNPVFSDKDNTITGTTIKAHSSPRSAEVIGNIKLVNKPQPTKDKPNPNTTTVTCDKLVYDYAKKAAVLTGHVRAVQNGKIVVSDNAIYESDSDMVYLTGNIKMKNNDNEELRSMQTAESVTLALSEEWVDIVAKKGEKVEIIFEIDE